MWQTKKDEETPKKQDEQQPRCIWRLESTHCAESSSVQHKLGQRFSLNDMKNRCYSIYVGMNPHQSASDRRWRFVSASWSRWFAFSNLIGDICKASGIWSLLAQFLPVRQNRARRHSHSFRPLHDVSGFKVVPPTLPRKEPGETPEGWWSISLPFSASLIPPVPVLPHFYRPGPAVSGSMRRHCTLSHALNGERGWRRLDRVIWIWCQWSD